MGTAFDADVVIVGAGPAGLACAHGLRDLHVQVLERADAPGGRILSRELAGLCVDLGACFACEPAALPPGLALQPGRFIAERGPLGLVFGGSTVFGDTPLDCLGGMALPQEARERISRFAQGHGDAAVLAGTAAQPLLQALLHQLHPGPLADYDPAHQRDGLYAWYPDHWERGNGALVDALLHGGNAEVHTGADVTSLCPQESGVRVEYRSHGAQRAVRCRRVVIATTADVAAGLWPEAGGRTRRLLEQTRYGSYLVVALAGAAHAGLRDFRALVIADGAPMVVMQQRSAARDRVALLCYHGGPASASLADQPDAALVALSRRRLAEAGLPSPAIAALDASAVQRWERAGTILSRGYLQARALPARADGGQVFLAGDYACPGDDVGYGIGDALKSGAVAAAAVRRSLA